MYLRFSCLESKIPVNYRTSDVGGYGSELEMMAIVVSFSVYSKLLRTCWCGLTVFYIRCYGILPFSRLFRSVPRPLFMLTFSVAVCFSWKKAAVSKTFPTV